MFRNCDLKQEESVLCNGPLCESLPLDFIGEAQIAVELLKQGIPFQLG